MWAGMLSGRPPATRAARAPVPVCAASVCGEAPRTERERKWRWDREREREGGKGRGPGEGAGEFPTIAPPPPAATSGPVTPCMRRTAAGGPGRQVRDQRVPGAPSGSRPGGVSGPDSRPRRVSRHVPAPTPAMHLGPARHLQGWQARSGGLTTAPPHGPGRNRRPTPPGLARADRASPGSRSPGHPPDTRQAWARPRPGPRTGLACALRIRA